MRLERRGRADEGRKNFSGRSKRQGLVTTETLGKDRELSEIAVERLT